MITRCMVYVFYGWWIWFMKCSLEDVPFFLEYGASGGFLADFGLRKPGQGRCFESVFSLCCANRKLV